MKQFNLFKKGVDMEGETKKYSTKIEAPIYTPKNKKPHIIELCEKTKTNHLINKIDSSNLSLEEKSFLKNAAQRHLIFNYEKIADYYAQSSKEMQNLMEASGLVIIDFEKAIDHGYVKLCSEIRNQYLQEYEE